MVKALGAFIFVGIMLAFLIFSTPVTRLGSGFLIGDGQHVFTYHDLVKEAEVLNVKFPNEDDIETNVVFSDHASNLAILKLKEVPKVKALPLVLSASGLSLRNESVFTLGYPWTNTMEDEHKLIEGTANTASVLINLKMDLDPVHSGSPLFNMKQEVVGMVLLETHAKSVFPASHHFAIPKLLLDNAMKAGKMDKINQPAQNISRDAFILKSRNNIVLIEAR